MKRILIFILTIAPLFLMAQSILPLRADTVRIYKQGGNGELRVENSTRNVKGILVNIDGKGTISSVHSTKINDSTIVIGGDTLRVGSGAGCSGCYSPPDTAATLATKSDLNKGTHIVQDLTPSIGGDSVYGGGPLIMDRHSNGHDTYNWYLDSTDFFMSGPAFRTISDADTSKKAVGYDPGTKKLYAMHWPQITQGFGYKKVSIAGLTTLDVFGDSYTTGYVAEDAAKIYPKQLRDSLSLTLTNYAVNASPLYNVLFNILPRNYNGSSRGLVTVLDGLIDVISNGSTTKTRYKTFALTKSILANCLMSSVHSFNSTTKVNFTPVTGAGILSRSRYLSSPDSLVRTTINGATCSFSFTGDNLVLGTFASTSATTIGTFTITIDSYPYGTYSGNNLVSGVGSYSASIPNEATTTSLYPDAIVIRGLTNTSHTVVITTTSSDQIYMDYYGSMPDVSAANPILFSDIPHLDINVGFNYSIGNVPTYNIDAEVLTRSMHQAINIFNGYPVASVSMNNFWNPYADIQRPDNLHPSTLGENDLYKGFRYYVDNNAAKVSYTLPPEYNPSFLSIGDTSTSYIQNQTAVKQTAGFKITGTGQSAAYTVDNNVYNTKWGFEGYGSTPSLHSNSYFTNFSDQNIFIYQSTNTTYKFPEARLSTSSGISSPYGGILNAFNYNSDTESEPFYIITSGYAEYVNNRAGSIHFRPGTDWSNKIMTQYTNDSIYAEPAGTGVFLVSGNTAMNGSVQFKRRAIANTAATLAITDYILAYTSITAARAVTLPTASSASGMHFEIIDESGSVTGTFKITIVGTVNGATNPDAVTTAYGHYKFYSNGTSYFTE